MATYVKIGGVEGGTSFGTLDGTPLANIILNGNSFDNIVFKNGNTVAILKETFAITGTTESCTSAGTRIGTSTYDGKVETKATPALGHYVGRTYTQGWGSNGCNTSGWTTTWCGRCGTQLSSTVAWSVGHKGSNEVQSLGWWGLRENGHCYPCYRSWWTCCGQSAYYW